jgi:hypothetical protein
MQKSLSHKTKHFLALVIKLFIVIGCGYFVFLKLTENNQLSFSDFTSKLTQNHLISFKICIILSGFTIFNWFLEITKWHLLINKTVKTSFYQAITQSLASLTSSLITPNRIGEYGAKALYFKKQFRKQIVGLNLIGNLYQMAATLFFGIIGVTYFALKQNVQIRFSGYKLVVLIILLIIIFFVIKFSSFGKHYSQKAKKFTSEISRSLNVKIGTLSIFRFIIFSHQFYFLLIVFNADIAYLEAITTISSMYLIASIIPMLSLFDVVIKSTVAIWVFSYYFIDETTIITITLLMWILNFVIPSIVGSYFVLTFNTNKLIAPEE